MGMSISSDSISFFAETNARRPFQVFGIKQTDRLQHVYVIGKTGTGKSTLLETLALQDMSAGRGFAVIDPSALSPRCRQSGCRSSTT